MKFKIFKWFFKPPKNARNHSSPQPPQSEEDNLQLGSEPTNPPIPHQTFQKRIPLRCHKRGSVKKYVATNMKLKSYPTSPRRQVEDDRGYVSDYHSPNFNIPRQITKTAEPEDNSNTTFTSEKEPSTFVYMAQEQRDSTPFKPRATLGSSEPFPFMVPTDQAPRHSLFYDLSYGAEAQEVYEEEEQIRQSMIRSSMIAPRNSTAPRISRVRRMSAVPRNSSAPRISTVRRMSAVPRYPTASRPSLVRRVSIIPTARDKARALIAQRYENIEPVEEPLRRTLVKVRPYRIANSNESEDVHRIPLKPPKNSSVRISIDGKLLHPVNKDKIRNSLRGDNVQSTTMKIVKQSSSECLERNFIEEVPTNDPGFQLEDPNMHNEMFEVFERPNNSEEETNEGDKIVYDKFHFNQTENEPVVYAVPTVTKKGTRKSILQTVFPSRGRTKSVLQDSAKSLTSKNPNDRPEINRKNIRFSTDADVFASEPRRASFTQQPMYVNMERGGTPVLVSEVLNPITSLFISDLKDPIPKDPLNKPKEKNVWVKPRTTQPATKKPTPQIQVYQGPSTKPHGIPNQKSSNRSHSPYDDDYTSSDESIIVYKRTTPNVRKSFRKQGVYAAQTPNMTFPQYPVIHETNSPNEEPMQNENIPPTKSNDFCGLEPKQNTAKDQRPKGLLLEGVENISNLPLDFEDELDLICYPSENMLKDSPNASKSKSKLRWRIVIKRGEDN